MSDSVIPRTAACQASLSITNSRSLLKPMFIESVMPSNHLILYCPLLLLPSVFPSIMVWSFIMSQFFVSGGQSAGASASGSVLPMNIQKLFPLGLTGWISLQSKGTVKSLLQHHSSKASVLRRSAFFMVQFSHPYMITGKTIALTRCTFVGKDRPLSASSSNTREDFTHEHHQTVNTKIRLIIFFAAKDGEALYSQQKQDWELTVAQIMNSLLPNSD